MDYTGTHKLFLPGEAGSWHWVSVLIHTIITFVYKKAKQYETSAPPFNLLVATDTWCISCGDTSVPCLQLDVLEYNVGDLTPCRQCYVLQNLLEPSWVFVCWPATLSPRCCLCPAYRPSSHPLPRLNHSICTPWSRENILTKRHLGGNCGFPCAKNVIPIVQNVSVFWR